MVCGFRVINGSDAVPSSWAMSRFIARVMEQQELIEEMFHELVRTLTELLPELGKHLAFDGKALPAYSTGRVNSKTGEASDPEAAWGKKAKTMTKPDGTLYSKALTWFGYQLHLIVDADYELPLSYEVLPANASEVTRIVPMVDEIAEKHPDLIKRTKELSADRGLDAGPVNSHLLDQLGIRPIIDNRAAYLFTPGDELAEQNRDPKLPITRSLNPEGTDNIVFSERGTLYCVNPLSGEYKSMSAWGYEKDRKALKWRCPAAATGTECPARSLCEGNSGSKCGSFGRVVRVPLERDRRIFIPTPRDTAAFEKALPGMKHGPQDLGRARQLAY